MTTAERWVWHTDVYAFRVVYLDAPFDQRSSPVDPDGKWYDERLVLPAIARKRSVIEETRQRRVAARNEETRREGRDIVNKWAEAKGYADIDAYAAARGISWDDAYMEVIRGFPGPKEMPRR